MDTHTLPAGTFERKNRPFQNFYGVKSNEISLASDKAPARSC